MDLAPLARADRRAEPDPAAKGMAPLRFAAALLAIAAAASLAAHLAMRAGIGLSPDSDTYLTAARQLARGHGFVVPTSAGGLEPLTHYPPLYPALLALLGKAGLGMLAAARLLNLAAFAGSIVLVGVIFRYGLKLSRPASLAGAAAVAVSVDLIQIYAMVWSEGPFIFLMLLALLMLGWFVTDQRRTALAGAALAVALAMLARLCGNWTGPRVDRRTAAVWQEIGISETW